MSEAEKLAKSFLYNCGVHTKESLMDQMTALSLAVRLESVEGDKEIYELSKLTKLLDSQAKELTALRAWKAKARPYIEELLAFLQNCLEEASGPIDEGFEVELKELEELSELTELLKEEI